MSAHGEDIDAVVEEEVRAALARGIARDDLPVAVADRVRQRLAGLVGYVRKRKLNPAERKRKILSEFNGKNAVELAKKYEVTTRRIMQIVAER